MLDSTLALIFARNFSIYENQVQNKFHSPLHMKDLTVNDVSPIAAEDHLHEALQKLLDSDYDKLPVMSTTEGERDEFLSYIMYLDLMRVYSEEITKFEQQE